MRFTTEVAREGAPREGVGAPLKRGLVIKKEGYYYEFD